MEVKLIAMTGVMCEEDLVDGAEQVCNHAAKTCTREDAGRILDRDSLGFVDTEMNALRTALRSGHESILEHAVYTFEVKGVSRALTHQLVRHRVASYSQQSQRYVGMENFSYIVPQSIRNNPDALDDYIKLMGRLTEFYVELVSDDGYGIPEEDARYILPNACTTNIIITMNARELRHFFSLRCCERAQWEIRELANRMLKICKEVSPIIFEGAGPSCVRDGFCRESKSCGRAPKLEKVLEVMNEMEVDG